MESKPSDAAASTLSPADEAKVRETLERVLESQAFRKSEQCRRFLRYVVEHRGEPMKERSIGSELFGRPADYDTAEDPVVRVRATEVRKRLAQYYGETADARDVRFEIPSGAYQVEIRWPAATAARPRRRIWPVATVAVCVLLAGVGLLVFRRRSDARDVFWAPAIESSRPVLIYCGQPVVYFLSSEAHEKYRPADRPRGAYALKLEPEAVLHGRDIIPVTGQFVGIGNAHTAAMLAVFFAGRGRAVEIRYADDVSFGDLRSGPSVLIGAFSNLYTLEMQDGLRFTFEQDGGARRIRDRSSGKLWSLANLEPDGKTPEDYAVVSRVFDSRTGQLVVTTAGITQYGTRAAGEFLTSAAMLSSPLARAPAEWRKRNVQVLLHTAVYRGSPGPADVVAVHEW